VRGHPGEEGLPPLPSLDPSDERLSTGEAISAPTTGQPLREE
jgi:hypothetical protein